MTYTTRDGRQLATRAAWQPHWAKALAYVSTVIPLGMAGTGVVTLASAAMTANGPWMLIGVGTALLGFLITAPAGMFIAKGGKLWFSIAMGAVGLLVIALAVLAWLSTLQAT